MFEHISREEMLEKLREALHLGDAPVKGPFGTHIRKEYLGAAIEEIERLVAENAALRAQAQAEAEKQSPCSLCGYGGKHLDAPPCTTCPAHPKEAEMNEPLTQAQISNMHFDKIWLDYGSDPDDPDDPPSGEWAVVLFGKIYSIDTLEGAGFEEMLFDLLDGETLDHPSGQYTVYRRKPEEGTT